MRKMYKRSKIEMKKNIYFLILMLIIILLDQFSKMKILDYMLNHSEELTLLPFLNFTLVFNSGVAFGIFSGFGQVVPHIFSLIGLLFDGTNIVGNLAAKDDFNPGFESSKTIELCFLIPLN